MSQIEPNGEFLEMLNRYCLRDLFFHIVITGIVCRVLRGKQINLIHFGISLQHYVYMLVYVFVWGCV